MGLSFTIAAGPRQRNHCQVRVPRAPHFTFSNSRFPPTWRTRSPYLYPPGTGWFSYNPRHWVPFSSPPTTRRATVEVLDPASTTQSQNQSQSYFTTSGLPAISSSWRQAPWKPRREIFLFSWTLCGNSPYVTSSLMRRWVCLLWIGFAFVKCTYRTYSMLLKILPSALCRSPLLVQTLQSRSCLSYVLD
jgi:hypothetical protein